MLFVYRINLYFFFSASSGSFLGRSIYIIPHKFALNYVEFYTSKYVDKFLWKSTYFIKESRRFLCIELHRQEKFGSSPRISVGKPQIYLNYMIIRCRFLHFMWKKKC